MCPAFTLPAGPDAAGVLGSHPCAATTGGRAPAVAQAMQFAWRNSVPVSGLPLNPLRVVSEP